MVHIELERAVESLHAATAIYTAEPIVDQLLDRLNWTGEGRLVDPSCGDGSMLGRALTRYLRFNPGRFDAVPQSIQGWEIHPGACEESKGRLSTILTDAGCSFSKARSIAEQVVQCGDFLVDGPTRPTFMYFLSNPPYLRFLNVPQVLRSRYKDVVPDLAAQDMLHSFLERSVRCLFDGGEIALVVADRVLTNSNAAKLRAEMGKRVSISHVSRLDVKTCFYRPKSRRAGTPPRIHPIAMVLTGRESNLAKIPLTLAPVFLDDSADSYGPVLPLGQFAEVRMAPWLGNKNIFQLNRQFAQTLPIEHLVPAVDSRDVAGGAFRMPSWFAIRTRPDTTPPQIILDHLEREMPRMSKRGRRKVLWNPPESWHQWDLTRPSLLIPRVAKDLTPTRINAGILPVNHVISIPYDSEAQRDRIEATLTSPEALSWFQNRAPRLENGFYSVSVSLLRTMPLF